MNELIINPNNNGKKQAISLVIAGRPNVGKSTIFNRLIKKRKAITDSMPGVTRDPIHHLTTIEGYPVRVTDTGGYKEDKDGFHPEVTARALKAASEADIILLVMDVTEITAEDEELLKKLRPYSKKVILAVNKVDDPKRKDLVWNYYQFGFETIVPISAAHSINFDLLEEEFVKRFQALGFESTETIDDENPDTRVIRVTLLGQPNTGKSTLSNILSVSNNSIVSDIPGTTRDVIENTFEYMGRTFYLMDTAGIRRKSKVNEDVEYYSVNRAISTIEECDVVLLLIDAEKGLSTQDKKIAALAAEKGRAIILVVNKVDLMEKIGNAQEAFADRIRFLFPILGFAPIVFISAKDKIGIDRLLNITLESFYQLEKRIDTHTLNEAFKQWMFDYMPPAHNNFKYKVKYMTQINTNPVEFLAFVNKKEGFPQEWVQYLTKRIRKDLVFNNIPVQIFLKESEKTQY